MMYLNIDSLAGFTTTHLRYLLVSTHALAEGKGIKGKYDQRFIVGPVLCIMFSILQYYVFYKLLAVHPGFARLIIAYVTRG